METREKNILLNIEWQ